MDFSDSPSSEMDVLPKGSKTIRLPCEQEDYHSLVDDKKKFKTFLDAAISTHPELFPNDITKGYVLNGKSRCSAKLDNLQFRKIKIQVTGEIYSIYPSFVMPHLIAYTKDVEHGLLLRKHDVPYSTLVHIFGRDEMFWYRAEQSFGRGSIVGTTVKKKKTYQRT